MRVLIIALIVAFSSVAQAQQVPRSQQEMKLSFAPLVKQSAPAVVNIYTTKNVRARARNPLFDDPFFRHFFGDQFAPQGGGKKKKVQKALGSGVILRADGVVVTNHHVIEGADDIKVVLADKREFVAKLVGSDPKTDLAVLKIDTGGEKFPVLPLADSDNLEVGDLVLAIGNPFGVGQTVTSGIVSATARTSVGISDYKFFIQTDASINPGNSGGALVAMDGSLIGVNVSIISKSGGSVGLGFAIPVNMVRAVVSGILTHGKPVRAWLGAGGQGVTSDLAESLGIPRPTGVLIESLDKVGPAYKAGLRVGDVVLAVNDKEVTDVQSLRYRIATLPIGGEALLRVLRRGKGVSIKVPLMAALEEPPRNLTKFNGQVPLAGAEVANINPALMEELGQSNLGQGPLVLSLNRGSIAARLGFRPGDVIKSVNGVETPDVAALKGVFKFKAQSYDVVVRRKGKTLTIRARR